MDFTPNLNLPIPNADAVPPKNISDQFPDIALALTMLDAIIHNLQGVVAGKAESNHTQAMSTITGLVEALAAKMPANQTFSLDSLTDVQGAAEALVNYVLVKNASGFWVPSTALAALGVHNHAISEVVGLADLLEDISEALDLLVANKADKSRTVTGAGLATGGGDLSANRVITVTKATDAEHQARDRDDVAATPKGIGLALVAYNKWETIGFDTLTAATLWTRNNLSAFERLILDGEFLPGASTVTAGLTLSTDNGATWVTTGGYVQVRVGSSTGGLYSVASVFNDLAIAGGGNSMVAADTVGHETRATFKRFNKPRVTVGRVDSTGVISGGRVVDAIGFYTAANPVHNAMRIVFTAAVTGTIHLEGLRG